MDRLTDGIDRRTDRKINEWTDEKTETGQTDKDKDGQIMF
jgi:hypothetical protein